MTVDELIEKLDEMPDDLEVWIMGSHFEPMRQVEVLSPDLFGSVPDRVVVS